MKIRVGFGYDVHQLQEGRACKLGGVVIPSDKGPYGHSDADVLIHAVCDALLGAAGLRDIGFYFPNNDEAYRGIDSTVLLEEVVELIGKKGFTVSNIDATLVLEQPKVNPHIEAIKLRLASLLQVTADDIGIKATTNEKLGFIGREEGVCAYAVALIQGT
jgi:2-C-methyl-D-erythritol 2,4-cyclodiphosphate synthase